ncbi:Uncharacterized conserved protein, DUF1778 family [Singulisphaera sp. GP187]|nr:Uncharacterized conserved protein, DUF1778 family [Singulisphaera sp. GP187]
MAVAVKNDGTSDDRAESTQVKGERLDLRIASDVKGMIEKAATISGLPVSAFVLSVVVPHARQVIHESQQLTLSSRDRDRFLAALDDENAKPNAALLRAAERFNAATR